MLNYVKVVPYDKSFELKDFDYGEPVLNKYLTNYASQDIKRYLFKTGSPQSKSFNSKDLSYGTTLMQ